MEDVDYAELITIIETSGKKSYDTYEINGKPTPNVGNLGGKTGEIAKLERQGEYYGIAVQLMEDFKPILTHSFVIRILSMLKREDYITPLAILNLSSMDQLQYILHKWFQTATTEYNDALKKLKKKYPVFDEWIESVTHDPLLGRIKVVEIGQNQTTGGPVVPMDWIDREFASGRQMHKEMSKLESRIGKPPVTFAIIYSMIIQKNDTMVENIKQIEYKNIYYLDFDGKTFRTELTTKPRKNYQYVKYTDTLIGFKLDEILEPKGNISGEHTQSKLREVGLLVSRLQKSIRRGRYGSKALIETVDALNVSPNYNLPEHGFLRVSAAKQLVWRLYITILEDCRPYQPINELSLLDLLLLVLITQKVQEYKFRKPVLELIKLTAVLAQFNDTPGDWFDWRALPEAESTSLDGKSELHDSISLALNNLIMMSGDRRMLQKIYSEKKIFEPFMTLASLSTDSWKKTLSTQKYILHDPDVYEDIVLSSYDPHSNTYIILYYQAAIEVSFTTKEISGYIWDKSSCYNVRSGKKKSKPDPILRSIQNYFYQKSELARNPTKKEKMESKIESKIESKPKTKNLQKVSLIDSIKPDSHAKRTSFLILFGRKYKSGGKEVVLAGTKEMPARVKIENEWAYYSEKNVLDAYPQRTIVLTDIDPPIGYKWKKNKVTTEIVNTKPLVDGTAIPYFDGSSMLESITPKSGKAISKQMYKLIIQFLSGSDINFSILLNLRETHAKEIYDWKPKKSDLKKINMDMVKSAYTKIFNQFNNIIMIGPVTRSGQKMQNSINYLLEGKLWAVFNLFCYLYPDTFRISGALNFHIKKETPGYVHLVNTLEYILFDQNKITGPVPVITTELWDHQKDSVNRILGGFRLGRHGFGDASSVGAGKTLTGLKIAADLIRENNTTYSAILVMLPGNKLIKTWADELERHTEGFDIIYQGNSADIGLIKRNTILVTTMGRMRDHPINHKWLLIIIDECLTVQNKNALWTQEAWVQSMMAKHVVMMSATFFRTRFDKLYYMLKMLNTGLPERREYLDTILLESIVSQVASVQRKWTSNFNYFELDPVSRKKYDAIDRSDMSTEAKFSKLTSVLVTDQSSIQAVTAQLKKLVKKLESKKHKCLIYARAMDEAKVWSKALGIPIYPEKGEHCIVTYNDGTYGLNDLVIYDTIVMRPPPPDRLPQIKGRLDRPGQKLNNLSVEYFVLKNTIEEGLIIRMNIASQFIQKYIMPLSKFYDVSVHHKKYLDEENNKD